MAVFWFSTVLSSQAIAQEQPSEVRILDKNSLVLARSIAEDRDASVEITFQSPGGSSGGVVVLEDLSGQHESKSVEINENQIAEFHGVKTGMWMIKDFPVNFKLLSVRIK